MPNLDATRVAKGSWTFPQNTLSRWTYPEGSEIGELPNY